MRLFRLRKAASALAVAAAFGALAHTGELPLWALPLFAIAFVAALLTDGRLGQRLGSALTWGTVAAMGLLVAAWWFGAFDLAVAASLFACVVCANRMLARRKASDDWGLYLTALMMVAGGAALSGSVAYGAWFAAFAVLTTFALTLSHLERVAVEFDAPEAAVRRLLGAPLLVALGGLSLFALLGALGVFFTFPRFTTGMLSPALGHRRATSGFSDSMRLDGVGTIKDDPRVVAHLTIEPDPLREELEASWRGAVFERFDGRVWAPQHQHGLPQRELKLRAPAEGEKTATVEVEILPEGGSPAVFLPEGALRLSEPRRVPVRRMVPTLFFESDPLGNVTVQPRPELGYAYRVLAGERRRDVRGQGTDYPNEIRERCLALPALLDPRVPELARRWTAGLSDPLDKAEAIERELNRGYSYTLELPGETADPLANFLFTRRAGHCEYFASAMTVLLRTVGVPARNATGYYGGQRTGEGTYVLRAGDAHAWTEVYFPDSGFVPFDPTPAMARASTAAGWREKWADLVDRLQGAWLRGVLDFSIRDQAEGVSGVATAVIKLLAKIHGRDGIPWKRVGLTLAILVLALGAARRLWRLRRRTARLEPGLSAEARSAVRLYRALLSRLGRRGIVKRPGQTPRELVEELRSKRRPEAEVASEVTERYLAARYGSGRLEPAEESRLRRAIRGM